MRKPAKYIDAVRSTLQAEGPLTAKELASRTGYSLSAVYSALRTLSCRGELEKSSRWRARYKARWRKERIE